MREKSEDKTSHLRPGNIDSKGVEYLKKLAKKKQKELSCKRSEALELVAKEHGFKNWNNVCRFVSKRPNSSSKLNIEGIWRKPVFLEIKSSETTFEMVIEDYPKAERIKESKRVNLTLVKEVSFSSGFVTRNFVSCKLDIGAPPPKESLSEVLESLKGDYEEDDYDQKSFLNDPLSSFYGQQFRIINVCYPGEEFNTNFIFFDDDEYHRAKRVIDDLTGGKSK